MFVVTSLHTQPGLFGLVLHYCDWTDLTVLPLWVPVEPTCSFGSFSNCLKSILNTFLPLFCSISRCRGTQLCIRLLWLGWLLTLLWAMLDYMLKEVSWNLFGVVL